MEIPGNTNVSQGIYWSLVEGYDSSRLVVGIKVDVRLQGKRYIPLYKCPRPTILSL